jgi:nucleotide-binding universal stress UspA family protein
MHGRNGMSYSTLLLHIALQDANAGRLAVARELADRFDAVVIGTAACNPEPPPSFDGIYPVEVIQFDRAYAKERLEAAEAEFRQGFAGRENRIEWRGALAPAGAHVARLCRAADLVITGAVAPELLADPNWRLDPGDLVMRAGRPVLVVPEDYTRRLQAKTVVIGWKDNRESRRAVGDALPLARLAERVLVASVAEVDDDSAHAGVADVLGWFRRHGVTAEERSEPLVSDPASQLRSLALEEDADLIVAGAYGHSRAREWILGGVTHDLLTRRTAQCLLMSH